MKSILNPSNKPDLGILSDEAIKYFQEIGVIPKDFDISNGFIIEFLDKDTKDA